MKHLRVLRTALVTSCLVLTGFHHSTLAADEVSTPQTAGDVRAMAGEVYKARALGASLYRDKKYDEAYPYLMTAATHGFKTAQAQLGYMHLGGLGNAKKDTRYAIGWLGVAAEGETDPDIKKLFDDLWKKIPAEQAPAYQKLVDSFVAKYGAAANNVKCARVNKAGSHIRKLRCMIYDPDGRSISDALDDVERTLPGESSGQTLGGRSGAGGGVSGGPQ
jgi:hypothetical protein